MPLSDRNILSPLANTPGGSSSGPIPVRRDRWCPLCLSPDAPRVRAVSQPLSAFGAPRISVPRQIGNYPLARARAVAAGLRLIDFFDERTLTAAVVALLYHFRTKLTIEIVRTVTREGER